MPSLEDQLRNEQVAKIVTELAETFSSFGVPDKFCLGTDIRSVVEQVFIIAARRAPNTSIATWARPQALKSSEEPRS